MAEYVFTVPDLGEGLIEATVLAWRVVVGQEVELNAPLAEVETAKATVELPSPVGGRVLILHAAEGASLEVGAPLVTLEFVPRPGIVGAVPSARGPSRSVRLRRPPL